MSVNIEKKSDWVFVQLPSRVDAFNFKEVKDCIEGLLQENPTKLALDFSVTSFVNFLMIRFIHEKAGALKANGGQLVLLSASEKIKRQFRIYASLDPIETFSRKSELTLEAPLGS